MVPGVLVVLVVVEMPGLPLQLRPNLAPLILEAVVGVLAVLRRWRQVQAAQA